MKYRFNILRDRQLICDPDGEELTDTSAARDEAVRTVRELAAEELRGGRQLPISWTLLITDELGALVEAIGFGTVILSGYEAQSQTASRALIDHRQIVQQSELLVRRVRLSQAEVSEGLSLAWSQVREITGLAATLSTRRCPRG